jgi:hypothetical protein
MTAGGLADGFRTPSGRLPYGSKRLQGGSVRLRAVQDDSKARKHAGKGVNPTGRERRRSERRYIRLDEKRGSRRKTAGNLKENLNRLGELPQRAWRKASAGLENCCSALEGNRRKALSGSAGRLKETFKESAGSFS